MIDLGGAGARDSISYPPEPELWTLATDGRGERWCGERLSECEPVEDRLVSPLLPGFEFDLSSLRS